MRVQVNQLQLWIYSILVALLPLSLSLNLQAKIVPPAILFLTGAVLVVVNRDTRASYRYAWPVTIATAVLMLYDLLNVIGHGLGWRPLDHGAHVLLYLVVAAVFSRPLKMRLVWSGFSATAIVFGSICLVQHYGMGVARAHSLNGGPASAIEFAMIQFGLALMALIQLLRKKISPSERVLHAAGMLFGMYGALLTQSRGPLLAFVPMFLAVIVLHVWRTRHWRWALLLTVAFGVGAVLATATLGGNIVHRLAAVEHELVIDNHRPTHDKSINERVEMWRTAERAIKSHPWVGIGIDQFNTYAREEIVAGRSKASIERFNHPHNEYLEAATGGGIPGLLVMLLIFLAPLAYFARHIRHDDETVASAATGGAVLIGLYMLCAITDSVFYRVMPQSFYFFIVLGYAVLIAWRQRPQTRVAVQPAD